MTYPGGKNAPGIHQRIINLMPPHAAYVEPFLGSGAIMRLKRPALENIGVDLCGSAIAALDGAGLGAELVRGCGLAFLESSPIVATGSTMVYADPPYLRSTRSGGRMYEFEMTDVDHRRLLRWAIAARCMVMISGYASPMYARALRGWRCVTFTAMTRGGPTNENLWCNFPPAVALHDYRYLGADYRERERIRRKKRRWSARLARMPLLERQALLSAIGDTAEFAGGRLSP